MTPAVPEPTYSGPLAATTTAGIDILSPGTGARRTPASMTADDSPALLAAIDASVRLPVLLFFASSISWLLLGSALAAVAALKLNLPSFLVDVDFLTFGRVHPASTNCFLYGWASAAGIGAGLWIMARLCHTPLRGGVILVAAWLLWNLAVTLGVAGILYGQGTSYEALEFPSYVSPLLFTAFVFIGMWVVLAFRHRRAGSTYISQWYLLAAFLFFPWTYATANLLVFFLDLQAPAKTIVAAWYAHAVVGTWLVPLGLAVAYFIVPKVLGRPIAHYSLARIGFWTWLIFSSWSGAYDLIGGPAPAWLLSVSIVASALTVLPLYAFGANFKTTLEGRYAALRHIPSMRFVVTGFWCFVAAAISMVITGFRGINAITHLTTVTTAQHELMVYGFASMAFFGAVYYIVPRLLGFEWESPALLRGHFWFSVVGMGLFVVGLTLGGLVQGLGLNDPSPKVDGLVILSFLKPFLFVQLVAVVLTCVGHVCFTSLFALALAREFEPTVRVPFDVVAGRAPAAKTVPTAAAIAAVATPTHPAA